MSEADAHQPRDRLGRALYWLSRAVAVTGGVLLLLLTVMTVASVVGRNIHRTPWLRDLPPFSWLGPIPGDFELIEIGTAIAVFGFLPFCHLRGGNVAVDFFTAGASAAAKSVMTVLGNVLYLAAAGLITWRMTASTLEMIQATYQKTTMILHIPVWWGYVPACIFLALLCITCLYTLWRSLIDVLGFARPQSG